MLSFRLDKGVIVYICDSRGVRDIYDTDGSGAIAASEPLAVLVTFLHNSWSEESIITVSDVQNIMGMHFYLQQLIGEQGDRKRKWNISRSIKRQQTRYLVWRTHIWERVNLHFHPWYTVSQLYYPLLTRASFKICSKIQSVFQLSDGSGLAVTVARYETPAHTDIDKVWTQRCL